MDQAQGLRDFVKTLNERGYQVDAKPVKEESFEAYLSKILTPQSDILMGLSRATKKPIESHGTLKLANFGVKL